MEAGATAAVSYCGIIRAVDYYMDYGCYGNYLYMWKGGLAMTLFDYCSAIVGVCISIVVVVLLFCFLALVLEQFLDWRIRMIKRWKGKDK